MKKATRRQVFYVREFLRLNSPRVSEPWFHDAVRGVLGELDAHRDSDKKQRARIRDLTRACQIAAKYIPAGPNWRRFSELTEGIDLSDKSWRKGGGK